MNANSQVRSHLCLNILCFVESSGKRAATELPWHSASPHRSHAPWQAQSRFCGSSRTWGTASSRFSLQTWSITTEGAGRAILWICHLSVGAKGQLFSRRFRSLQKGLDPTYQNSSEEKKNNWKVLNQTFYSSHQILCAQAKDQVIELISNLTSPPSPAACAYTFSRRTIQICHGAAATLLGPWN